MANRHNRITLRSIGSVAAIAAVALLPACQQLASYPPVEVTANMQRPAAEPVPTIMAETVRYMRAHYAVSEDLPLNLPEGVPPAVYDKVFLHLNGGTPMTAANQKAIHITQVRTRGQKAQVDLIYPTPHGFNQFLTVDLETQLFEAWHVTSDRQWAVGSVETPAPHYLAAPSIPAEQ